MRTKIIIAWAEYTGYSVVRVHGVLMIGNNRTIMYVRDVFWQPKFLLRWTFFVNQDFFRTQGWKEAFNSLKSFSKQKNSK